MTLGALGVVFGDIGTSPLYALKQAFSDARGLTPNPGSVYGVLSLVFCSARARWGQDQPYVPAALQLARRKALDLDLTDATSFLSRVTVVRTKEPGMAGWRERLFCLIGRNAVSPAAYFGLPAHQVVSLGSAIDI